MKATDYDALAADLAGARDRLDWVTCERDELKARAETAEVALAVARSIISHVCPAIRDVLWCALVWNDHNFTTHAFSEKAKRAASYLGFERGDVDAVNAWIERIDAFIKRTRPKAQP